MTQNRIVWFKHNRCNAKATVLFFTQFFNTRTSNNNLLILGKLGTLHETLVPKCIYQFFLLSWYIKIRSYGEKNWSAKTKSIAHWDLGDPCDVECLVDCSTFSVGIYRVPRNSSIFEIGKTSKGNLDRLQTL